MLKVVFHQAKKHLYSERGMALAAVLVVSTVLALASGSYLSTSTHEAKQTADKVQDSRTLYAAESGVSYARDRLTSLSEWGSNWENLALNTSTGLPAQVKFSSSTKTITSSAAFNGHSKGITVVVDAEKHTPFDGAACGCEGVLFSGSSLNVRGDIGSNKSVTLGGVTLDGNIIAHDDLAGDNTCSAMGKADIGGTAGTNLTQGAGGNIMGGISENIAPPPMPCDCGAIDVVKEVDEAEAANNNANILASCPVGCLSGTQLTVAGNKNVILTSGDYYFTQLSISGSAKITIPTGEKVRIFLEGSGPFDIAGGGIINDPANASNLRIYSSSTQLIDIAGNSTFSAAVYAPYADVKLRGTRNAYGAVIAKNSLMEGSINFVYDPNLANEDEPPEIDVRIQVNTVSWSQQ